MTLEEAKQEINAAGLDPSPYIRAAFRYMETCDDPDDEEELQRELARQVAFAMEES
jgi:hypothetical protein